MIKDSAVAVWFTIVLSVCVVIFALIVSGTGAALYPTWLGFQRNAVEQSKSYVDSANGSLTIYSQEYTALDAKIAEVDNNPDLVSAYRAQQKAILNNMCQQIASMKIGTVARVNSVFVAQHGGC